MTLAWQSFTVPKSGHTAAQNEDALAVAEAAGRAAVADGASEGWQSGAWAQALSRAYIAKPPDPATFSSWLAKVRAKSAPDLSNAPASWYVEEKQATGAFATLLGLQIKLSNRGSYVFRAVAVGDTLLVHRRGPSIHSIMPIETAADFGTRPKLIGSRTESGEPEPEWFAGRAKPGDTFDLMSDAVAEWFMRTIESGGDAGSIIDTITMAVDAAREWDDWVQSLRQSRQMKNDDATLVRVRIGQIPE
jgi:hypothetical protein